MSSEPTTASLGGGHSSLHSPAWQVGSVVFIAEKKVKAHAEQEGFGDAGHDMF